MFWTRFCGEGLPQAVLREGEQFLYELAQDKDRACHEYNEYLVDAKQELEANSARYQQMVKHKTPAQFWVLDGQQWPQLRMIATRLFALVPSSAASERSFSARGFLHSKSRNKLSHTTLEKLMFVRSNHLLAKKLELSSDDEDETDRESDPDI
jgi:hypothetical protein